MKVKIITGYHRQEFEDEVNLFLKNNSYHEIQYQLGTEDDDSYIMFSVLILYFDLEKKS